MLGASVTAAASGSDDENRYKLSRLVSDKPGVADQLDPNLVNAWGLVAGPTTPWWVANNGTDTSTLYDGAGHPFSLIVNVAGAPTGTVFNGGTGFVVTRGGVSGPSVFLFATEGGTIRGWNPAVPPPAPSTKAFKVVDRSSEGAIFKGLAIASTATGGRLYATDFHNGRVDVFDESFDLVTIPGAFEDPDIPTGYAPFGIQAIGSAIFVTYAKQDADAEDDVAGAGFGFVDMYSLEGELLGRVASQGVLNAPWGLAMAPETFGEFGGDLLVGNFGDGTINAFEREADGDFEFQGTLHRRNGNVMSIDGLWAIQFGNGEIAGPTDSLFFTAGPNDERHGLFGKVEAQS
ncbi:MAG: TIGR03118 family protein [Actinomycetota bacterium]|nr:TIGR03118 family protein [Actinomycetota bacterium]